MMNPNESADLQRPEQRQNIGVTEPSVCSSTTGKKDREYGSRRDGDDPKLVSDRRTESFSEHSPEPEHKSSLQHQSAFPGDNVDDGGEKTNLKEKSREDDGEGHLNYQMGLVMKDRYEVVLTLGGVPLLKWWSVLTEKQKERVAVKIVRNKECFREVGRSEVAVLEEINSLDDDITFACVRMLDWFEHDGHVCIVFELLGLSIFEFLRQNHFLPFNVEQIRHMAFQIFRAVCFLHRNKLTHTDLKPENILFVCSDYDLQYNEHRTHDSKEHLAMMEKILGPIPPHLLEKTRKQHYVHNGHLNWDKSSTSDDYIRKHLKPLKNYMHDQTEEDFFDLLGSMLEYDVYRRITLEEALWHPPCISAAIYFCTCLIRDGEKSNIFTDI
ncbi:hypothetical protein KUCAC02_002791 [Chaenocephalus aceratus]|uniref:Uncharacterized protein n=1 Tax=Chaenocephalus aceratus TaxID=36190 RepID=A0ACB9WK94_CHAAC|nr:hypothetical protein KUCAC02_002791 [Chaenocephalus aceratus]